MRQQRLGRAERAEPAGRDRDSDGDDGGRAKEASASVRADGSAALLQSVQSAEAADHAARQAFFRLLVENGISPEQFHRDLLAALRDSQNGQADGGAVFQGLAAGLTVDATA